MPAKALLSLRLLMAVVMFLIFAVMVVTALGYPAQARFMPLVVGIPGVVLTGIELLREIRQTLRAPVTADRHHEAQVIPDQVARIVAQAEQHTPGAVVHEQDPAGAPRREIILIAYVTALTFGILAFGFYLATPVFAVVFLKERERMSWSTAVLSAAAIIAVEYFVFTRALGTELFQGFITERIMDWLGPSY